MIGKNPGDHWYVYEDVSATGPFVHQAGQYTRPGDVTQLIKNVDDRFVVFGTGDEVQVDFDPSHLPKLQDGWVRDYFFFADGYEKDMDFYAADGLTVEPLPYRAMGSYPYAEEKSYPYDAEHLKYLLDYNTRFYAGRRAERLSVPLQECEFSDRRRTALSYATGAPDNDRGRGPAAPRLTGARTETVRLMKGVQGSLGRLPHVGVTGQAEIACPTHSLSDATN